MNTLKHFLLALMFPLSAVAATSPELKWTLTENISNPESAYYDAKHDVYYISNIAGGSKDKDGIGWIAKVTLEGDKPHAEKWVEGLNAPKGIRIYKGTLWVADIDEMVAIDLETKKVTKIPVIGAEFLNDTAVDESGKVYVSDTTASKIFTVENGKSSLFMEGAALEFPNGLLVEKNTLFVAGWGQMTDKNTFATSAPGNVYTIDLTKKTKTSITKKPLGNLDGLERLPSGAFLVSDWVAGKVYSLDGNGEATLLLSGIPHAADLAWDSKRDLLIQPSTSGSKIFAYKLGK